MLFQSTPAIADGRTPPIGLDAQPIARNTPGHGINPSAKDATRKDNQGKEARCT